MTRHSRDDLLTRTEAAAWLRVTEASVRRFVAEQKLRELIVGGSPRYRFGDLLAFAAGEDEDEGERTG